MWSVAADELSERDCDACSIETRLVYGCFEDGITEWFSGTQFEGRRCPRALIRENPDFGEALRLHAHTDGRLGPTLGDFPSAVVEAVDVISDARAWREEQRGEQREAARKAEAG